MRMSDYSRQLRGGGPTVTCPLWLFPRHHRTLITFPPRGTSSWYLLVVGTPHPPILGRCPTGTSPFPVRSRPAPAPPRSPAHQSSFVRRAERELRHTTHAILQPRTTAAAHPPPRTYCQHLTAHRPPPTLHRPLPAPHRSPLPAHRPPRTAHRHPTPHRPRPTTSDHHPPPTSTTHRLGCTPTRPFEHRAWIHSPSRCDPAGWHADPNVRRTHEIRNP